MVGEAKSRLESNPIPARDARRAHQDPETPEKLRQTCLWGFECLLQRPSQRLSATRTGALAAAGPRGPTCEPAIELPSTRPTNRRTIIPRSSHTGTKVLEPITDFPTWGSRKGTENLQGFDFGGQWDLQNFHRTGGTDSWGAQTTTCAYQDPEERSSEPTRLS